MDANVSTPDPVDALDASWRAREAQWRHKLGRLRLGAEPIEEQLARYRRATWVLTDVVAGLACVFFALFAGRGYPVVGLALVAVLLLPIVLGAWADHGLMALRARRYRAEAERYLRERERLRPSEGRPDDALLGEVSSPDRIGSGPGLL